MAVNFQLTRKSDMAAGPVDLINLDEEICEAFGAAPDEKRYYLGWYDSIGWRCARGLSWDEIRQALTPGPNDADLEYCQVLERLREITTWLEERFEVRHWNSWG